MADLSSLTITGRLTKDATVKSLPSGKSMLQIDIAVNVGFGKYENTYFVKAQKWSNFANIQEFLVKGTRVACYGTMKLSEWDSREGKHYTDIVLDIFDIILLPSGQQTNTSAKPQDTSDIEDIVF